jgi:hypothetical protein
MLLTCSNIRCQFDSSGSSFVESYTYRLGWTLPNIKSRTTTCIPKRQVSSKRERFLHFKKDSGIRRPSQCSPPINDHDVTRKETRKGKHEKRKPKLLRILGVTTSDHINLPHFVHSSAFPANQPPNHPTKRSKEIHLKAQSNTPSSQPQTPRSTPTCRSQFQPSPHKRPPRSPTPRGPRGRNLWHTCAEW